MNYQEKMKKISGRSIKEWTKCFRKVYSAQDQYRRPEEFWNATMAHLSSIGESIRKNHYPELLTFSAHAFCWMCSFAHRLNDGVDPIFSLKAGLSDIVGFKYPMLCGYCESVPCKCLPIKNDNDTNKVFLYKNLIKHFKNKEKSITDRTLQHWFDDFWQIYCTNIHLQTMESIGFHLLEEAGETAKAIRGLIQFRGIQNANISGINQIFLEKLCTMEEIVSEYYICIDELKSHFKVKEEAEAIALMTSANRSPIVLKTKFVKAKLDLITELADTFSWFCNVQLKLREITNNLCNECAVDNIWNLESILNKVYNAYDHSNPITCYACGKHRCECVFFHEKL